jgi:hypothetical protein
MTKKAQLIKIAERHPEWAKIGTLTLNGGSVEMVVKGRTIFVTSSELTDWEQTTESVLYGFIQGWLARNI